READGRTGGVGGKLTDEVSCHRSLFAIEQELFEFANVLEGSPICECAGRIHRQAVVEGERLTRKADPRFRLHVLREGAISVTPAAHHIEAFERESRRIDVTVAGSAGGIGAVTIELLADGDSASDIRLE